MSTEFQFDEIAFYSFLINNAPFDLEFCWLVHESHPNAIFLFIWDRLDVIFGFGLMISSEKKHALIQLWFYGLLTHWGLTMHICVSKLTIIGANNGLSPGRRQAIIWTNAGILLIGPYGTNFSEISIAILTFSFTKMSLKVSSAKWLPFCLGLNVLTHCCLYISYYMINLTLCSSLTHLGLSDTHLHQWSNHPWFG